MNKALVAYLEDLMDFRKPARLRFRGDNGGIISLQARITDLDLESSEPALLADGAIRIPLHRLMYVNDQPTQAFA